MHPYPPTVTDRQEALRTARYLSDRNVAATEIYVTLVDDLGVQPHTALGIMATAA